jgi:hypothetical protein
MKTCVIEVRGGVASPVKIPTGVRIVIKDRDIQTSDKRIYTDKHGDYARKIYS